MDKITYLKS